jgi:hypothetical protein
MFSRFVAVLIAYAVLLAASVVIVGPTDSYPSQTQATAEGRFDLSASAETATNAQVTYVILTTSDWTSLTIRTIETISVSCTITVHPGGSPSYSSDSQNINIAKPGNFNLMELTCSGTISGLGGADTYVTYHITRGDAGTTTAKVIAQNKLVASRGNGWDIPVNPYNDLKFAVPDEAHSTGNLQRQIVYDITTTSDWTQLNLVGEESFSSTSWWVKQGSSAPGLAVSVGSSHLQIGKTAGDATLVEVLFTSTLNNLRVGSWGTEEYNNVKYDISKLNLGSTTVRTYAPGASSLRNLISTQVNSQTGSGILHQYYRVIDNRHIFWDNIVSTVFYAWHGNPNYDPADGWTHWEDPARDPPNTWASDFMPNYLTDVHGFSPVRSLYDSNDPNAVLWQIDAMKRAGIELALGGYWGVAPGGVYPYADKALLNIIQNVTPVSSYPELKWAIFYELFHAQRGSMTATDIYNDLKNNIWNRYMSLPNYARVDGKPVLFIYVLPDWWPPNSECLASRWNTARAMLAADGIYFYFAGDVGNPWISCPISQLNSHESLTTYDAYFRYWPSEREYCTDTYTSDSPQGDSCYVAPGAQAYWDHKETLVRSEAEYENQISAFADHILGNPSSMRFMVIETWNEWLEGTQIEPGRKINYNTNPYTDGTYNYNTNFVDRTWNQVKRWKAITDRPDIRMTSDAAVSTSPAMAADSAGNFHLVWVDARNGNNEIYYKKVDTNWNVVVADTRLTANAADSVSPAIAITSSGTITVLWSDNRDGNYEIYRKIYTTSWDADTRRTTTANDSKEPDIGVDSSGNRHYVWREVMRGSQSEDEEIQYRLNDGTVVRLYSWSGARLTQPHSDRLGSPHLALGNPGTVHVVFSRGPGYPLESGTSYMYYKRYSGGSWGSTIQIGTNVDVARLIRVDADANSHVYVVWHYWGNGFDIAFRKSNDGGGTFSAQQNFGTGSSSYQAYPDVAFGSGGRVYLTWADNSAGQYEIYSTRSGGYGELGTWMAPTRRTDAAGDSVIPRFAVDQSSMKVGLVWRDLRDGNMEIYFAARVL